jgi:hypothetical protein
MSSLHQFVLCHLWCIPLGELFDRVEVNFLLPRFLLLPCHPTNRNTPDPGPGNRKAGSTPSLVKTPPPQAINSRRSPSASLSINHTSSSTSESSRKVERRGRERRSREKREISCKADCGVLVGVGFWRDRV